MACYFRGLHSYSSRFLREGVEIPHSCCSRRLGNRALTSGSPQAVADTWQYPVYASQRISDRKSVFLAHASTLPNAASFPTFLKHLTSLPVLKRASHCMYAYRTVDTETLQPILGQSDGGESGSGDRLARLVELSGCENVVIVVSRWYGGVKLGSDRWRLISSVANEALVMGSFKRPKEPKDARGKSKRKRK